MVIKVSKFLEIIQYEVETQLRLQKLQLYPQLLQHKLKANNNHCFSISNITKDLIQNAMNVHLDHRKALLDVMIRSQK